MKTFLSRDAVIHAPQSSVAAFVSAYTAGADGAFAVVHETRDGELVVVHDADLATTTTFAGKVAETPFQGIRRLDIGVHFKDWKGTSVRYTAQPMSMRALLRALPRDLDMIIELTEATDAGNRDAMLDRLLGTLRTETRSATILVSREQDLATLRSKDANVSLAVHASMVALTNALLENFTVDLVVGRDAEILQASGLTALGTRLDQFHKAGGIAKGVAIRPLSPVPSASLIAAAGLYETITIISTASILAMPGLQIPRRVIVDERFNGREIDTETWALGYARVGDACHVYQDEGIHVAIKPFQEPNQEQPPNDIETRLRRLENTVALLSRRTPTYSGGGVGFVQGIDGAFAAEVVIKSERAAQGTMAEIAVLNANPGRHQPPWNPDGTPHTPRNDHESHSFFDPHGAPPFVGSEHDEDDGFRINSHFASEYTDNNYGPDAGDGRMLDVTLRIERRGSYFAAYFRPTAESDAQDWICSGTVRNDSLNPRVYLRCAGKRWRKADFPVQPNHFIFSRVTIIGWSG